MNYDFTTKESRRRFVRTANALLRKRRPNVILIDGSKRTPKQNDYMHVLCRILAVATGTTEGYAKQMYFKNLSNKEIFYRMTKDPLTNTMQENIRSSSDLTVPEMAKAISNFIRWSAEQGYDLPKARINKDGTVTFESEKDEQAFHQAEIETSKLEEYL